MCEPRARGAEARAGEAALDAERMKETGVVLPEAEAVEVVAAEEQEEAEVAEGDFPEVDDEELMPDVAAEPEEVEALEEEQ